MSILDKVRRREKHDGWLSAKRTRNWAPARQAFARSRPVRLADLGLSHRTKKPDGRKGWTMSILDKTRGTGDVVDDPSLRRQAGGGERAKRRTN